LKINLKNFSSNPYVLLLATLEKFDKLNDKHKIDLSKVTNLINSNLPADIRVYCCKLVTGTFDVRKSARCRLYEYIAPLCLYQSYDDIIKGIKPTIEFRD